ncbi:hypothetical protein Mapa_007654 [Marchantia paleacea]|nr:hypothetical protein Mapa_007654 [Marchantia paleacea]
MLLNYSEVAKLNSTKFWVLCGLGQTYISTSKCWITFRLTSEDSKAATYVTRKFLIFHDPSKEQSLQWDKGLYHRSLTLFWLLKNSSTSIGRGLDDDTVALGLVGAGLSSVTLF